MGLVRRFRRDVDEICRVVETACLKKVVYDEHLLELVLVLEDKRFFRHPGVDVLAGLRAAFNLLIGNPRGGASTIDMQFARTVTGYRARTVSRKLYEAALAIAVKRKRERADILNAYLTVAYFGSGVIGAESASGRLFRSPTNRLSLEESAVIAALLVYPIPLRMTPNWRYRVRRRSRYGLARRESLPTPLIPQGHVRA